MSLLNDAETFQQYIPQSDVFKEKISKRSVGWHLEHCLQSMYGILKVLQRSNPKDYKSNFNFQRSLVLGTGWIPRGVGKASKDVNPKTEASQDKLEELVVKIKDNINAVQNASAKSNFKHPVFGLLNKKQTLKFIAIHNKHHLKIIKEILVS
ncbi:MAG: DinB family protein [Aureispira sp.]|nr:DinB family protein [Aureispira sp.]